MPTSTSALDVRRADDVHHEQGGWFDARWHFSFGSYHDRDRMGVGPLRVFNDDRIVAGAEWPMHPHRDIESLTWVVEGRFEHADSLGNGGRFEEGAAQVMRFSSHGARHSERNASDEHGLRFIQFWILPSTEGLSSDVQQRQWTTEDRQGRWLRIMSGRPADLGPRDDGVEGPLELAQDATADAARLPAGDALDHTLAAGRGAYLYVIDGAVHVTVAVDDERTDRLATGDALALAEVRERSTSLDVAATEDAELLLVDVPLRWEPVGMWATHG